MNNDWGSGAADVFGKMLKEKGVQVGVVETMDAAAQDMNAQLAKIKSSDADTLFVTTAVEQLTLVLQAGARARAQAPDHHHRRLADPRPADRAGGRRRQRQHAPRCSSRRGSRKRRRIPDWPKAFVAEWRKRGYNFAGLTEGFRGYDGIHTIAAAIEKAGKAEPEAIRAGAAGTSS